MNIDLAIGVGGLVVTVIMSIYVLYLEVRKQNGRHE